MQLLQILTICLHVLLVARTSQKPKRTDFTDKRFACSSTLLLHHEIERNSKQPSRLIENFAQQPTSGHHLFHLDKNSDQTVESIRSKPLFDLDSTNSPVSNSTYLLLSPLEGLDEWLQWQEARATIPESWPLECKDVADASSPFGVPVVLPACLLQPPILQPPPCLSSIDIAKHMGIPWYSIPYIRWPTLPTSFSGWNFVFIINAYLSVAALFDSTASRVLFAFTEISGHVQMDARLRIEPVVVATWLKTALRGNRWLVLVFNLGSWFFWLDRLLVANDRAGIGLVGKVWKIIASTRDSVSWSKRVAVFVCACWILILSRRKDFVS